MSSSVQSATDTVIMDKARIAKRYRGGFVDPEVSFLNQDGIVQQDFRFVEYEYKPGLLGLMPQGHVRLTGEHNKAGFFETLLLQPAELERA